MSEESSPEDKTEEPTAKRINDFRERGEVAKSTDLVSAVMLLTGTGAMMLLVQNLSRPFERLSFAAFTRLHESEKFIEAPGKFVSSLVLEVLGAMAGPIGLLMVAALAANFMQTGWIFSSKKFEFKPQKFNPFTGIKNLFFSKQMIAGLLRSLAKVAMLGSIAVGTVYTIGPDVGELVARGPLGFADYLLRIIHYPKGLCAGAMLVLGGVDPMWQRHTMHQKMKMTREELKREMKQSEGDPMMKGRRRAKHFELLGINKMVQEAANADVIINNPTHISVALRYRPEEGAPRVLAMGTDNVAMRIREVARENNVHMVTNVPLARALHKSVKVGHFIPEEFFRVVAEVLAHVYAQRR
ncbi:MAG: EscU/YscU/HrcU family type III secretion system export apparatus switch protein [Myxococcota bacterium]|nr:EscU/YscU/HrcU family type III secretion system export apparatus switch protein [Myxococcota bacterium]